VGDRNETRPENILMNLSLRTVVFPVLCLVAACGSQGSDETTSSPTAVSTEPLTSATASTPALDQIRHGGSFLFSLDESDPATMWHDRCGKESGGDAAKADACYAHIREVGSHEGMRFSVDADQRVILTSFGLEDGKDAVYLEGPLALRADGDHAVIGTFSARPHGLQMDGSSTWPQKPVRLELEGGGSTLVMTDEVKGRLVFHRTQATQAQ
jgi:hypothetical protein